MVVKFLTKQIELIPSTTIEYLHTLDPVLEYLERTQVYGVDTETTGLDARKEKILLLQIGDEKEQFVIDVRNMDLSPIKPYLESYDHVKVLHNAKFDYKMLKQAGITMEQMVCTMLQEMVIYNGRFTQKQAIQLHRFTMVYVYNRLFKVEIDKEQQTSFIGHPFDKPFTDKQIQYAADDVKHVMRIYHAQFKQIERYDLGRCTHIENTCIGVYGDMELNGFLLSRDEWSKLATQYLVEKEEIITELDEMFLSELRTKSDSIKKKYNKKLNIHYNGNLFEEALPTRNININWGSPKQLLPVLFDLYKIIPTDKYGKLSTGMDSLEIHAGDDTPFINLLLKKGAINKAVSTYGFSFLEKYMDEDGRVRFNVNQIKDTGRISQSKPNLQNIPADTRFRSCFKASPGNKLVIADYSGQELRIIADFSQDKQFLQYFIDGEDVHSKVASLLYSAKFGRPIVVTKNNEYSYLRAPAKNLNFKLAYGGTAFTLKHDLNMTEQEAQELINLYFQVFPGISSYFDIQKKLAVQNGYIIINKVLNRRRWLKEFAEYNSTKDYNLRKKLKGAMERKGTNTPIQGTGGDMKKMALILAREAFKNMPVKLVNDVHDEIVADCKENIAEEVAQILVKCMMDAGKYFIKSLPMEVDYKISDYWSK